MNLAASVALRNVYRIECRDRHGNLKWVEEIKNLTVTEGLNHLLNTQFKSGAQVGTWHLGLKGTGSVVVGDTLASHGGWSEVTPYAGNRPALVLGSVANGAVNNQASPTSISINATQTIAGAFVCSVASGTVGVLYGAADFAEPRSMASGDTLNVTVALSAASA